MKMKYSMTWDLDSIYEGGSQSKAFRQELMELEQHIVDLKASLLKTDALQAEQLAAQTENLQYILLGLRQAESFVSCLMAQNMFDEEAVALNDRVAQLNASFTKLLTVFDNRLRELSDMSWDDMLKLPALQEVAFNLTERRELAKKKMSPELEALAADLAIDGYHGWGDFYNTIVARTNFVSVNEQGEQMTLSAGQMANKLSEGDRSIRSEAFQTWEKGWEEQADFCADTLNRIAGFRLKWYQNRKWESFLEEPLQMNRMSKETLDAMWQAVEKGKALLVPYFERKAKLFGVDKLDWHDVEAPLSTSAATMNFDEGAKFIIDKFAGFSEELAKFAEMAFEQRWIEAEDRPGKRPGGFCTSLPKSGQTRIFMTYSGTASNVSTLAHELGHAYHQHVMNDMPALTQEYAMNVAETASTFAELIVSDQALKEATDKAEQLAIVEDKIQRAVAFYMNIHARFIFESAFYEARQAGPVPAKELNRMMVEAQKQAFNGLLGQYHPHFWAAKLHFYLTDVPFYNFPYTFGYLFSAGIYKLAARQGPKFIGAYDALLRDTGRLTVEQLALEHLQTDLTKAAFWDDAVELVQEDVKLFLQLTE